MTFANIRRRTSMMQTAVDMATGEVVDVSAKTETELDRIHGIKNRRRLGIDARCKGCGSPVVLVHLSVGTWFWRHAAGATTECAQAEFNHSESPEHLAGKLHISRALRKLTGFTPEAEHFASAGGVDVFVDVFARFDGAAAHAFQATTAFEVQMSPQTHGDFVGRTEGIAAVTGARTLWVTPHEQSLDSTLGLVVDRSAGFVDRRVFEDVGQVVQAAPVPLEKMVSGIFGKSQKWWLSQSGDITSADRRAKAPWIVFPRSVRAARTPRRAAGVVTVDDRACDRAVSVDTQLTEVAVDGQLTKVGPGAQWWRSPKRGRDRPDVEWLGGAGCSTCGLTDAGAERLRAFGFPVRTCSRCVGRFGGVS